MDELLLGVEVLADGVGAVDDLRDGDEEAAVGDDVNVVGEKLKRECI